MELIYDVIYSHPILSLIQAGFMVWMLLDARRRAEAEPFWFWVILFVPFLGAWVYFFVMVVPDLKLGRLAAWFQPRASLDEMRYRTETTPTLVNHVALAQRLMEQGGHDEALPHLEAARKLEPEHGLVLYTLARCHVEQGHPQLATPILEGLLKRDPRWSNYAGWRLLARARAESDDAEGAVQACRDLVRLAATMEYTCLLGEYLLAAGQTIEAQTLLENTLRDHDFAPGIIRRRNRRWAREARRLLREADTKPKTA
jgi:hypothetical protein